MIAKIETFHISRPRRDMARLRAPNPWISRSRKPTPAAHNDASKIKPKLAYPSRDVLRDW